jgi:tRNA A37 methylthiotransferase MiaB
LLIFRRIFFFLLINKNLQFSENVKKIPDFKNFLKQKTENQNKNDKIEEDFYLSQVDIFNSYKEILNGKIYFLETYGCQMNVSDSEVVRSILNKCEMVETNDENQADVILLNTCSVRESAEEKIRSRLIELRKSKKQKGTIIGVLGCMAENKRKQLLDVNAFDVKKDKSSSFVDLIVGPDSYKDLPRMIVSLSKNESKFEINTQLSVEETYGDIIPIRIKNSFKAYVSISRGCNNMCSFCIVPYTRGQERSKNLTDIFKEIEFLNKEGVKEVTLLGQNVNSYFSFNSNDISLYIDFLENYKLTHSLNSTLELDLSVKINSEGFKELQSKAWSHNIKGLRFSNILWFLSKKFPEIRFRFTSPHPKDFPISLLHVINENYNVCKSVHLPLQSGNNNILSKMNRQYTQESYINLINKVRDIIKNVYITSDIIVGFCGESDEEFKNTLDVCKYSNYSQAYMFIYSVRPKTQAFYKFTDDVPYDVKSKRLQILSEIVKEGQIKLLSSEIGKIHIILIEGETKKYINKPNKYKYYGKNDGNITCVIKDKILSNFNVVNENKIDIKIGDWIIAKVVENSANTLFCDPLFKLNKLSDIKEIKDINKDLDSCC